MTEIRLENDLVLVRPIKMEDAKALAEVATDERKGNARKSYF